MSDWRHRAACRDEDPELFFPIGNTGPALLQIEDAKAVCRRCDVIDQCKQWALESGQDVGVWGGMSEDERRALKRKAARKRSRMGEDAPRGDRDDRAAKAQAKADEINAAAEAAEAAKRAERDAAVAAEQQNLRWL